MKNNRNEHLESTRFRAEKWGKLLFSLPKLVIIFVYLIFTSFATYAIFKDDIKLINFVLIFAFVGMPFKVEGVIPIAGQIYVPKTLGFVLFEILLVIVLINFSINLFI